MLFFWNRKKKLAEKNKRQGEAFLTENVNREGVITLDSGLQYRVLNEGAGESPTLNDMVILYYDGTLLNGVRFDRSPSNGEPSKFLVKRLIPGWIEALQLMKVGSKWQVFVPPHLAYGEEGTKHKIGPNATLIFEIELIGVE